MRLFKRLPLLFSAAGVVLIVVVYYSLRVNEQMNTPIAVDGEETLVFARGSSIRTLAKQLKAKGWLNDPDSLLIWGKLNRQTTRLQAGEYRITADHTLASLLDDMVAGKVIQHSLTLIEGSTFRQALVVIQQDPNISVELEGLSDEEIMARLGHPDEHPEGRFYPDTYHISRGVSDLAILQRAYLKMQQTLEQQWQEREQDLPYKSAYEALIMASIVEKESAIAEERPLIAGLFVNRLRKGMRLQTDPTVIYGIEDYDGDIRYRDLRKDTPYNTYTRKGLPPTPIALPGKEAIHAALHPQKSDYLYFVAYSDGSGKHVFSTNLKDHEAAVDRYQRKKKSPRKKTASPSKKQSTEQQPSIKPEPK